MPLFKAIAAGDRSKVIAILQADPSEAQRARSDGCTPLYFAANPSKISILPTKILISIADYFCNTQLVRQQVVNEVTEAIHAALQVRGYTLMFDILSGKHPIQNLLNQAAVNTLQEKRPFNLNPKGI